MLASPVCLCSQDACLHGCLRACHNSRARSPPTITQSMSCASNGACACRSIADRRRSNGSDVLQKGHQPRTSREEVARRSGRVIAPISAALLRERQKCQSRKILLHDRQFGCISPLPRYASKPNISLAFAHRARVRSRHGFSPGKQSHVGRGSGKNERCVDGVG
jgi:hypothetical protein